ncbi:MAG TPA: plastocyanin/azurin family copper-binding protein, partial [Gemmatimonadales bacterium]|nr:plastocyanin/azurin family copper-binding protein [Gemmatimonadales bacterium]
GAGLGCDEGTTGPVIPRPVKASDWVASVNWDAATVVEVTMAEVGQTSYLFQPSSLTFEAGKPYVLRITNPSVNVEEHNIFPDGAQNFYKAIATRKVQTSQAEYKAPHFDELELFVGGSLELYFVPVLPGTYDFVCDEPGHRELGMVGRITITGGAGNQLDLEVPAEYNTALATDPRRSGSHEVWVSRTDLTVAAAEQPSYSFAPKDLALTRDVAYRIVLQSATGNVEKHNYTAEDFYRTVVLRKAEESLAEIKAPYFKTIELLVGGSTELFVVPTVAGTFPVECTIPGHAALGMTGTIVVSP